MYIAYFEHYIVQHSNVVILGLDFHSYCKHMPLIMYNLNMLSVCMNHNKSLETRIHILDSTDTTSAISKISSQWVLLLYVNTRQFEIERY